MSISVTIDGNHPKASGRTYLVHYPTDDISWDLDGYEYAARSPWYEEVESTDVPRRMQAGLTPLGDHDSRRSAMDMFTDKQAQGGRPSSGRNFWSHGNERWPDSSFRGMNASHGGAQAYEDTRHRGGMQQAAKSGKAADLHGPGYSLSPGSGI